MHLFSNLEPLLRAPVGNNLENRPEDVENVKRHFAAEGRYKSRIENGYIDKDLDESIWSFQRDHGLKRDGIMNPGGETEAALICKRIGLPDYPEPKKDKGFQRASTLPIFGGIALGLGMTAAGATQWWQSKSAEERENVARSLDHVINGKSNNTEPEDCYQRYLEDLKRCEDVLRLRGRDTARICRETAVTRLAQCSKKVPHDSQRSLHTYDGD